MENPKFQVFKGKDDQFYFRLRAANGETVCASEGYTSKQNCLKGIEVIQEIAATAPVEDQTENQ